MNRTRKAEQARKRRHAHIRRGMRIALYEVNQLLAERGQGQRIEAPPGWIEYTVALAEGGRKKAPRADVVDRICWTVAWDEGKRRARQFVETVERVFS